MDNYEFFEDLGVIFDNMVIDPVDLRGVQDASNSIAGHLRQYRRRHLSRSQYDDRFDRIFSFLKDRADEDRLSIDDAAILDFWLAHSTGDEYRGYKTVFDGFVTFMRSLDEAYREAAVEQTVQIGLDRELGEVEPEDSDSAWDEIGDWVSPLNVLDDDPAAEIKFFKGEGERKPIEQLMNYGPYALRLPMAFMRLESFAPIQSGITVDLQVKRGRESIQRRMNCEDALSYQESRQNLLRVLDHVRNLQKAAYHAITRDMRLAEGGENVVSLFADQPANLIDAIDREDQLDSDEMAKIASQAEKAFRDLTRMGFNDEDLEDRKMVEGFKIGAGALLSIAGQLERMLKAIDSLDAQKSNLEIRFSTDLTVFRDQFHLIYGEAA